LNTVPTAFELARREADLEPLPDVTVWPQPAGLVGQDPASLIDLSAYLDVQTLRADFGPDLLALGTVGEDGTWPAMNGSLYGLPIDVDVKGLVYYSPTKFAAAGYQVPASWNQLVALSERIVADGRTPWCWGFSSREASGWPGTDIVETLLIRDAGPDTYDDWIGHDIPFDAPAVQAAAAKAALLMLPDGYARGGAEAISRFESHEGVFPLMREDPECYLMHGGDFLLDLRGAQTEVGVDIDAFPFPPTFEGGPIAATGGGSLMSVHVDRPEVRVFVTHAASRVWGEHWAAYSGSSFISPNIGFDLDGYGSESDPDAETKRALGRFARDSIAAGAYRFDASDLMPGPIGSATPEGERGVFWQGMLDVVDGKRTMDQVLTDIEAAWQELESG
jgi:alpha-glucoside transport system substrate-binding protein